MSSPLAPRTAAWLLAAAEALYALLLWGPYLLRPDATGVVDADFFAAWQLAVNDALLQGEWLHWNPYNCGGEPGLANPQSGVLTPFNLLVFAGADPVFLPKIEVFVHLLLCAWGSRLLARRIGAPRWFGLLGFFVFAGNGFVLFRVLHGQSTFYAMFLLPFLFAWLWPDENGDVPLSMERMLGGIAVLSLTILEDGVQVMMYAFFVFGVVAAVLAWQRRKLSPLLLVALWAVVPPLLCLARVAPMAELLVTHPRYVESNDFLTLRMAWDALFNYDQLALYVEKTAPYPHKMWAAYGTFVGFVPFLLAPLAFRRGRPAIAIGLGLAALLCFALMFGNVHPWAPWPLLRRLPVVNMVRSPYRFSIMLGMCATLLALYGGARWWQRAPERRTAWVLGAAVLVTGIGFVTTLRPLLHRYVDRYDLPYARIDYSYPFRQIEGFADRLYAHTAHNTGMLDCYRAYYLPVTATRQDSEIRVVEGDAQARLQVRPNRFVIDVEAQGEALLVLNQNHLGRWFVESGQVMDPPFDRDGLIALRVPRGQQRIILRYDAVAFRFGTAGSGVACLALGGVVWGLRRRRKTRTVSP